LKLSDKTELANRILLHLYSLREDRAERSQDLIVIVMPKLGISSKDKREFREVMYALKILGFVSMEWLGDETKHPYGIPYFCSPCYYITDKGRKYVETFLSIELCPNCNTPNLDKEEGRCSMCGYIKEIEEG